MLEKTLESTQNFLPSKTAVTTILSARKERAATAVTAIRFQDRAQLARLTATAKATVRFQRFLMTGSVKTTENATAENAVKTTARAEPARPMPTADADSKSAETETAFRKNLSELSNRSPTTLWLLHRKFSLVLFSQVSAT